MLNLAHSNDSDSSEQATIEAALAILESRLRKPGAQFISPARVTDYLKLKLVEQEREIFAVLLLDSHHRLIEYRELFQGTINSASVYPREVVKAALLANADAVIFAHNHPSGIPEPSTDDCRITRRLKDALNLIDVRTLDHFVIGAEGYVSLADRGLI